MCFITKKKTVEEIIDENSAGMTDLEKSQYWYELSMNIFNLLGKKSDVATFEITAQQWIDTALAAYPSLTDVKIPDAIFKITGEPGLQQILSRDWTNLVPYIENISDCDKYGSRLYDHLVTYYQVTGVLPVWGDTDEGPHGFDLAVLMDTDHLIARLVEPQSDSIFAHDGPLGHYVPQRTAMELGIKPIAVPQVRQ